MSDKQNKSRIFVVVLVILVVAIIAIGLFFTWLIIKDGEKNKDVSLIEPKQIYVIEQEKTDFNERSEEHTSELQSRFDLVCRLLLEKKNILKSRTTGYSNRTVKNIHR